MSAIERFVKYIHLCSSISSLPGDSYLSLREISPVTVGCNRLNVRIDRCCSECDMVGSFIASHLGDERGLCKQHAEIFRTKYGELDLFYFCYDYYTIQAIDDMDFTSFKR